MIYSKANRQNNLSEVVTSKRSRAKVSMTPDAGPSLISIRERAFELYESRGGEHGQDKQDWLRAEREAFEL